MSIRSDDFMSGATRRLSKSVIAAFDQCPRRLWLQVHLPDAAAAGDGSAQLRLTAGTQVGAIARTLIPESALIKTGPNMRAAIANTTEPLHPELKTALLRLHKLEGKPCDGPVIRSERDGHMTPRSIVNWFRVAYDQLGLFRCSSHSGRRTFITMSARLLAKSGGSLRDIQELAGHRSLSTTERYIEGDRDAQRRLIKLL